MVFFKKGEKKRETERGRTKSETDSGRKREGENKRENEVSEPYAGWMKAGWNRMKASETG